MTFYFFTKDLPLESKLYLSIVLTILIALPAVVNHFTKGEG